MRRMRCYSEERRTTAGLVSVAVLQLAVPLVLYALCWALGLHQTPAGMVLVLAPAIVVIAVVFVLDGLVVEALVLLDLVVVLFALDREVLADPGVQGRGGRDGRGGGPSDRPRGRSAGVGGG